MSAAVVAIIALALIGVLLIGGAYWADRRYGGADDFRSLAWLIFGVALLTAAIVCALILGGYELAAWWWS